MPDTFVLPNPYSPYADADPLYRHTIPVLMPSLFGEPAPGTLSLTGCEHLAVVPDEPLRYVADPDQALPAGLCPACVSAMHGDAPPQGTATDCRRCESSTRHNGLCAQCRQEQHADWWQASDTWTHPFRLVLRGKHVLDGAVFPNGQAIVIDDPEAGLSSGAASLEQLLAGYHRAEVMLAEDVIRVGNARVTHAVGLYTSTAVQLEDAHHELATSKAAIERASKLATQWAVLRAYGGAATELRATLGGREPDSLPSGFSLDTCVVAQCAVCDYEFDEDESHTIHFEDLDTAHATLRTYSWTVLADGRAICLDEDSEHQELRETADAPSQAVIPGQTALDVAHRDEEFEETGDSDSDVFELISEIAGRLSDATDEGEYHAVGLIGDLANGRKTVEEARAELAEITFRHV